MDITTLYKSELERTRELVQRPDWYLEFGKVRRLRLLGLAALQARFNGNIAGAAEEARNDTLAVFEQLLEADQIRLGHPGEEELDDQDEERQPIDTVVIHHSSRAEGISLPALNALHLLNLYVPVYQNKKQPVLNRDGHHQPIYSGHFDEQGKQVFYGYHWKVAKDGAVERLLPDSALGWHAGNWEINKRSVGICIDDDLAHKKPTTESLEAVAEIINHYYVGTKVIGHNEASQTVCPGAYFRHGWKLELLSHLSTAQTVYAKINFSMAQHKQPLKTSQTFKKVTIGFGYGLFILAVANLVISIVIPWATLLLQPYALNKVNIVIELVSFIFAVLLPPIIGFILGRKATHRHDRLTHHFNGVLFGIVAYWASIVFSFLATDTVEPIRQAFNEPFATIINAWPVLATLIVMSAIAFYYAHNRRQKDSVLQDRVYQVVLFAGILAIPIYEFLFLIKTYDAFALIGTIIQLVVMVGLVVFSRILLHRFQPGLKNPLSLSIVAVSMGLITEQLTGGLISLIDPWYLVVVVGSGALGVLVWLIYLILIIRKA